MLFTNKEELLNTTYNDFVKFWNSKDRKKKMKFYCFIYTYIEESFMSNTLYYSVLRFEQDPKQLPKLIERYKPQFNEVCLYEFNDDGYKEIDI